MIMEFFFFLYMPEFFFFFFCRFFFLKKPGPPPRNQMGRPLNVTDYVCEICVHFGEPCVMTNIARFRSVATHVCGTHKCEKAPICEKVARCEEIPTLNVKIYAICDKITQNVKCFIHLESLIYSHLELFSHIA